MKQLIFTTCLALFLVACGGGSDQSSTSQAIPATVLKANVSPDPTLVEGAISVVNTTTAEHQSFRAVGALEDGGYTVAWTSYPATGLFIQRYDALGRKTGVETAIPLASDIVLESMAVLRDGGIVVAYKRTDATSSTVFIQRFDASGIPVLPETRVFSESTYLYTLERFKVLALADGGFVVAFLRVERPVYLEIISRVFIRRYDSQGQPVGMVVSDEERWLTYTLAADARGGYTVSLAWQYWFNVTQQLFSVLRYDANQVAHQLVSAQPGTVLALALEGDRSVLFTQGATGSFLQLRDSAGNPVGAPTAIASMPFEAKELADGTFVAFWNTAGTITAQRYDSTGAPLGDVLTIATGGGAVPQVVALADGGFAAAWSAPNAAADQDVFTQAFLELPGSDRAALRLKRKACLESARGMVGQERKAFMDACLQ